MSITTVISISTIITTYILGILAKKIKFVNNKLIPIQNIVIGLLVALIEWIITKDFKVAIALSGIIAGGTYDVFHNLEKIIKGDKNE